MKILYAITKSNWGGAQRYVYDLSLKARDEGHDVTVVLGGQGVLAEKLDGENIEVISIPELGRDVSPLNDIHSFISLLEVIREKKPDILHINSSKIGGFGAFLGRVLRIPTVVFTAHGWAFNESRPLLQKYLITFFSWLTIALSHVTICVSDAVYEKAARWPLLNKKLVVIKNGIESFPLLDRVEAREFLVPGVPHDALIVGTIAELHHIKGLDILIRAFAHLEHPHLMLVIIGGGEEDISLHELARDLGVADRVHFKGFIGDARSYLSGFDIFTQPSRSEAFPFVFLEAGMARLPAIGTQVGGIPEIITDTDTGLLVPSEHPPLLARALERLIHDPELRDRLAKNLHTFVVSSCTKEKMLSDTMKIYARHVA